MKIPNRTIAEYLVNREYSAESTGNLLKTEGILLDSVLSVDLTRSDEKMEYVTLAIMKTPAALKVDKNIIVSE